MSASQPTGGPSPQVLQWLHRVIAPEYEDPQRTYSDVATALATLRTLSPRTSVYTYENGKSELLLLLYGTLQAVFRGSNFNVPVSIWVPHQYPRQPPMTFVTPASEMAIRPGNHVDPSGKCYHPYLAGWVNYSDRSNVVDLCDVLRDVFSREPPIMAKQVGPPPEQVTTAPPPVPPLPPELGNTSPKPITAQQQTPPPLPPLPKEFTADRPTFREGGASIYQSQPFRAPPSTSPRPTHPPFRGPPTPERSGVLQYQAHNQGPPLPPLPPAPRRSNAPVPPPPPPGRPISMHLGGAFQPPYPHAARSPPPLPSASPQPRFSPHQAHRPMSFHGFPPASQPSPLQTPLSSGPITRPIQPPQIPVPKAPQPIDLMDTPVVETSAPSPQPQGAHPPPPPPNPEKDHLIQQITLALHERASAAAQRTKGSLESAAAQREAMMRTEAAMERERTELNRLMETCDKDAEILRERISMAERVIEEAKRTEPPGVDEAVVAPSVVHSQLYDLVTEDIAIEDTIYVLGKALDREKISLEVFLKHIRTLAREQFLKRALVKKISDQLGMHG